jgi:hypothetical protein
MKISTMLKKTLIVSIIGFTIFINVGKADDSRACFRGSRGSFVLADSNHPFIFSSLNSNTSRPVQAASKFIVLAIFDDAISEVVTLTIQLFEPGRSQAENGKVTVQYNEPGLRCNNW